jgi:molybdate transport system regulatory protein
MNKIPGTIKKVTSSGNIILAEVCTEKTTMAALMIQAPELTEMTKEGNNVVLAFKESEVSIGKNIKGEISMRNQLIGEIKIIESGVVFSKITFEFEGHSIVSLITTGSARRLNLAVGDTITGFIKANEVMILANDL